jgi:16S rRNA (guanine527-N7)-methyltransferase
LEEARSAGFLGPGPIEEHLAHAEGFLALARREAGTAAVRILDLGSGGGLPGLVLASQWPTATVVLLEANQRRARFLEQAVLRCGLEDRVSVADQRAELYGREGLQRATFDGVVARSFGPPAVVAECAAPLLRVGGWLIVSEPPADATAHAERGSAVAAEEPAESAPPGSGPAGGPGAGTRWPAEPLARLGLEPSAAVRNRFGYQVLRQRLLCPDEFPRRNGVPAKRPLF